METLGERIKKRRIMLEMTQLTLAQKVGYKDKSTIAKIECGENDIPQSKIVSFAKALGTTPAYLMGWEEETPVLTRKDKRDIQDVLDEMKKQLQNGDLLFDGSPVSDEDTIAIIAAMETAMNIVKQKNKETYTPKKYRKDDGD